MIINPEISTELFAEANCFFEAFYVIQWDHLGSILPYIVKENALGRAAFFKRFVGAIFSDAIQLQYMLAIVLHRMANVWQTPKKCMAIVWQMRFS